MSAELLSSIFAVLLSLAASFIPGFSAWFAALPGAQKRLVMLAGLALIALASYGLACADPAAALGFPLACDQSGALTLWQSFLAAVIANQAAFTITPKVKNAATPSA
jgi:hypothetical protein